MPRGASLALGWMGTSARSTGAPEALGLRGASLASEGGS